MSLSFSQRMGLEPKKAIQIDSLDERTRNRICNIFSLLSYVFTAKNDKCRELRFNFWDDFLGKRFDDPFYLAFDVMDTTRYKILNNDFNKVFDLIEFLLINFPECDVDNEPSKKNFVHQLNKVFKEEHVGYSIINDLITPITSDTEIENIEQAMQTPIFSVKEHLKTALKHFSDREKPDYRNSIKESISAVEGLCQIIANNSKASLGDALNEIKRNGLLQIHPALEQGFNKIYGYTSDADGIRHALGFEEGADQEDALYMLVSCSAFINYLVTKCNKAGIVLK